MLNLMSFKVKLIYQAVHPEVVQLAILRRVCTISHFIILVLQFVTNTPEQHKQQQQQDDSRDIRTIQGSSILVALKRLNSAECWYLVKRKSVRARELYCTLKSFLCVSLEQRQACRRVNSSSVCSVLRTNSDSNEKIFFSASRS